MARSASRDFLVKKNGTTLASITAKSVAWNGTVIDVTADDDNGFTTALADVFANTTMEISGSGYTDDDVLSGVAFTTSESDKHLSDITLERPNGDVISGNFILTSYTENGSSPGELPFSV
jgi:predicted secreted protein